MSRLPQLRIALLLTALAALLGASPVSASTSHVFTTTFGAAGSSPTDPYPVTGPTDVEVDQASKDIYVADPGNHRVEKLDSSGHFLYMFGKEVNKTTAEANGTLAEQDFCSLASGDECQPGQAGESPGAFVSPSYLAVDNSCILHEPPLTSTTTPTCQEYDPSAGDVYVADPGDRLVSKFDATGQIVAGWGVGGQKNGADASSLPGFPALYGVAVNSLTDGLLSVGTRHPEYGSTNALEYTQDGTFIPPYHNPPAGYFLKVGPGGTYYSGAPFALDLPADELYEDTGTSVNHYATLTPNEPADSFGSGHLTSAQGVAADNTSHTVYVANTAENDIAVFGNARPIVETGPFVEASESTLTLTGAIDPAGRGEIVECHFEYGFDKSYGTSVPCTPDPGAHPFSEPTEVRATISGFSGGTRDHYRLVATNSVGATAHGNDATFITTQPPAIDGLKSEDLTATTATLIAQVNPNGLDTTYQFNYGTSTSYNQAAPASPGTIAASNSDHLLEVHLTDLTPGATYHYNLVATNDDGSTAAEDHTFSFYPPACPNENVRQQTKANYLPDCRAYELVSPENAGGTQLFAGGPNTGLATSPSRFAFVGLYSTVPGSGGHPMDGQGDLYVATRTDTGWKTRYVGLPATEFAIAGGPPMGPPLSSGVVGSGLTGVEGPGHVHEANGYFTQPWEIQANVLTDPSMSRFVDWNDGSLGNETEGADNAPYVWDAEGAFVDRWPTNLATVPGGNIEGPGGVQIPTQAGNHALACPTVPGHGTDNCPGDVTASSDLSHFVFATEWSPFTVGGRTTPPGSVYDNNTVTGAVEIASLLPDGKPIQSEPGDESGDPLQIPAVSEDGSHILMAAGGTGPCGAAKCAPVSPCISFGSEPASRCQMQASHLYMRVDDLNTYDVSEGHDVKFVGMTPDGTKVYFTSDEHLTGEDLEHGGESLYMWSEQGELAGEPLTLISKADNPGQPGEPGNTSDCHASFTTECGVLTYTDASYCTLAGGAGGDCKSDNSIAANGDIYFFSPELLDGSRGIPNRENLYVYRNGKAQYVTTITTGPYCYKSPIPGYTDSACSDTPVARMEVTPTDSHMAFLTASPVTQYENDGHLEMYTYDPAARRIVCVSCNPSGTPASSGVEASQNGLFMTDDGRTFFSTEEPLVHGDTDQGEDVYEYVDGHPQLITPGTGEIGIQPGTEEPDVKSNPGLIGVSANGTDVYFSTLDTLVPSDRNGLFIKFYDARTSGGFSAPPPPPSCEAADECHAAGSEMPPPLKVGAGAGLGDRGNFPSETRKAKKKKRHRKAQHAHRRGHRAAGKQGR